MDKTELLSKYLFDIHKKQLTSYYDGDDTFSWQYLVEKSHDINDIDRVFFRTIATDIIEKQKTDPDFETQLPKILYEVHASILPPYYISFADYLIYNNDPEDDFSKYTWTNLIENSADKDQVDKQFFRDIAHFIIAELKADT